MPWRSTSGGDFVWVNGALYSDALASALINDQMSSDRLASLGLAGSSHCFMRRNCVPQAVRRVLDAGLACCFTFTWLASSVSLRADHSVRIAWDSSAAEGVVDYIVYQGVRSGLYSRSFRTGGQTSALLNGLKEGVTYFCTVTAVNSSGLESVPASELEYAGPCLGRSLQVQLHREDFGQGLALKLQAVPGRKYQIESSEDLQTWTPAWTSSIAASQGVLEFVEPGEVSRERRFFRVRVIGPYTGTSEGIEVRRVTSPQPGFAVRFQAKASRAYEVQTSNDGLLWKTIWSTADAGTNGWLEVLDPQTNTFSGRLYRVLVAMNQVESGEQHCPDSSNQPPSISAPPPQTTYVDVPTSLIPLAVRDPDTPLEWLTLSASSSNPELIPESSIVFGGSGSNRTVRIRPTLGLQGTAVIDLIVSDGNDAAATAFVLQVRPSPPATFPLMLLTRGAGRIQPDLNGQLLKVGTKYTVTASAGPGFVFAGWTGDIRSGSASLSFVMRPNLMLEVNFVEDPFPSMRGMYSGLFKNEDAFHPATCGALAVTTTERGTYSGKFMTGGRGYLFTGRLAADGKGTNKLKRTGATGISLELHFSTDTPGQLIGRVIGNGWQASLEAYKLAAKSARNPSPLMGSYTVVLAGQNDPRLGPEGFGFGTVKVDAAGAALFVGSLADGTKVSRKARVSTAGRWPLYVPVYGGKGAVFGWQMIASGSTPAIQGMLHWFKPPGRAKHYAAGFNIETVLLGSRYVRPAPDARLLSLTRAELVFSGGDLARAFTNSVVLSEQNEISNLSANPLSLTVALPRGLFNGTVVDPVTGRVLRVAGALLQDQNTGAGYLLGTNCGARVSLRDLNHSTE